MAQLGFRTRRRDGRPRRLHRAAAQRSSRTRRRARSTSPRCSTGRKEAATSPQPLRRGAGPQARRRARSHAHRASASARIEPRRRRSCIETRRSELATARSARCCSGEIARALRRATGSPEDTIAHARDAAAPGRASAPSPSPGMTLELEGDANDYVGKGLSGGIARGAPAAGVAVPRRRPGHRRQHGALRRHQRPRVLQRPRRRALRGPQQRRHHRRRRRRRSRLRVHDRRHGRRPRHHRPQLRAPA